MDLPASSNAAANSGANAAADRPAKGLAPLRYLECRWEPEDPALMEALNGLLSAWPFEALQEDDQGWTAWLPEHPTAEGLTGETQNPEAVSDPQTVWDAAREAIEPLIPGRGHARWIEAENWNRSWEAAYPPIALPFLRIRASFHDAGPANGPPELVIDPQMSFGTGHHATTQGMLEAMHALWPPPNTTPDGWGSDWSGRSVIDLGTGTGVLAIFAASRGAGPVWGCDFHPFSAQNARDNAAQNGLQDRLTVVEAPIEAARGRSADLVLANINREVLLAHMGLMADCVQPGGHLLCSGYLAEDRERVRQAAAEQGLVFAANRSTDGVWQVDVFQKPSR